MLGTQLSGLHISWAGIASYTSDFHIKVEGNMVSVQYVPIDQSCFSISEFMLSFLFWFFLLMSIFGLETSQGNENCTLTKASLVTVKCFIWSIFSEISRVAIISLVSCMKIQIIK